MEQITQQVIRGTHGHDWDWSDYKHSADEFVAIALVEPGEGIELVRRHRQPRRRGADPLADSELDPGRAHRSASSGFVDLIVIPIHHTATRPGRSSGEP
jgi:hypothetical protein